MNAYVARRGVDFDPHAMSQGGFWRESGFWWLGKVAGDRTVAAIAGRSADPRCAAIRANALAEARENLAKVRDRALKARECGHRLPGRGAP